jgi:hypothetical protein
VTNSEAQEGDLFEGDKPIEAEAAKTGGEA